MYTQKKLGRMKIVFNAIQPRGKYFPINVDHLFLKDAVQSGRKHGTWPFRNTMTQGMFRGKVGPKTKDTQVVQTPRDPNHRSRKPLTNSNAGIRRGEELNLKAAQTPCKLSADSQRRDE